jgi:hypothetical protein
MSFTLMMMEEVPNIVYPGGGRSASKAFHNHPFHFLP